jgi:O-antigen/teichoic acid export membrane protein
MGIVKKHVYKNTLVSYIGMVVAYVNTILLFPFFTNNEEYGLYNLLISLSVLYSLVASLGIPQIISKYFPFYRTADRKHNGFIHWTAVFSIVGFLASTLLFIFLKPVIIHAYIGTSPLFVKYYYYLVPLALFTVFFNFLEIVGRIIYRTVFSSFLRDVLVRLITTVLLIMIALHWIDFKEFIMLYIASWGLISIILLVNLALSGEFSYRIDDMKFTAIQKKELFNYGLFTVISVSIYVLLQKVDVIMLSSIVGDAKQGVYSWYFNIAIVISVPASALGRTTYQIVSDAWKAKDMKNIADVYNKTSTIQMLVGCLLFIGIIINQHNLLTIVHDPEKIAEFSVFIVIGLGFLVDITGGLNTYIITTSHKYRLVTGLVIVSSLVCIGLNYVLIPVYGGMGAAIAYLSTMTLMNFCTWFYIKYRFQMQPFTSKHLVIVAITIVSYLLGEYFWRMPNLYLDIIIRSGITAAFYGLLSYAFHVSPDVNEKIDSTLVRFKLRS